MAAEHYLKPALMSAGIIKDGMIALEIGVGRGMKAAAFCNLFSEYIGVDLDEGELEVAQRVAQSLDLHYNLHCANAIDIIKSPSRFGLSKRPDFLILYAVLEHLLPDER